MVRLKVVNCDYYRFQFLFQFLNGAIKRDRSLNASATGLLFQFLNGAIKRAYNFKFVYLALYFNSSMVRLKEKRCCYPYRYL